ncbi:hypothetical protein STPL106120_10165 [Streptococcus pluranimalium]
MWDFLIHSKSPITSVEDFTHYSLIEPKNTDSYSNVLIGNSGSNLLRLDGKGGTEPDLATKVDVSDDALTYTATLRDGLK